ncbi:MAG: phenylacetate--CoA ligase family protein [Acidobacteria bacterium]|nr:phenylacetate--CoA ligase family protein [Acidobacteriota bacterium]
MTSKTNKKPRNIYHDRAVEIMPRKQLEKLQDRLLRKLQTVSLQSNPFYRAKFKAAGVRTPVPLSRLSDLPFTTKSELMADQLAHPPFGSDLAYPVADYTRMHQTSGTTGAPVRWLDTAESWGAFVEQWCFVYRGAGITRGDRVFAAFSFGPFSGFWTGFEASYRIGALAITGGGQTSEQRIATMQATQPTVLICTPTYALRLAEVAVTMGVDPAKLGLRASIHAGEPGAGIPSTRRKIEQTWGVRAYDHCGMTEMGAVGFECQHQLGPHVNEAHFILEVIDPKTGKQVGAGERGEIVLTNLRRAESPLIRYRTGDLAEATYTRCSCRRTFALLRGGLLGRADDMITIRGINVFPAAIENILRRFPEIVEFQGEVTREREMAELTLHLETDRLKDAQLPAFAEKVISALHVSLNLRPAVKFAASGTLPRAEMKSRRFRVTPAKS